MAPYFDHMHRKSTHERRAHAMRAAGVLTALVFAGWVTTLGLGATDSAGPVANTTGNAAQTAAAITAGMSGQGSGGGNQLVVATSTGN